MKGRKSFTHEGNPHDYLGKENNSTPRLWSQDEKAVLDVSGPRNAFSLP